MSNEEVDAKLDAWEVQGARIRNDAGKLQLKCEGDKFRCLPPVPRVTQDNYVSAHRRGRKGHGGVLETRPQTVTPAPLAANAAA